MVGNECIHCSCECLFVSSVVFALCNLAAPEL